MILPGRAICGTAVGPSACDPLREVGATGALPAVGSKVADSGGCTSSEALFVGRASSSEFAVHDIIRLLSHHGLPSKAPAVALDLRRGL